MPQANELVALLMRFLLCVLQRRYVQEKLTDPECLPRAISEPINYKSFWYHLTHNMGFRRKTGKVHHKLKESAKIQELRYKFLHT